MRVMVLRTVSIAFAAVSLSTLVSAQDATTPVITDQQYEELGSWDNLHATHWIGFASQSCSSSTVNAEVQHAIENAITTEPLKVGPAYTMSKHEPAALSWAWDLVSEPSATIARRKLFAINFKDVNADMWSNVVAEVNAASAQGSEPPRLSFIIETDEGFIGTPIKWNRESAKAIEAVVTISGSFGNASGQNGIDYFVTGVMQHAVDDTSVYANAAAPTVMLVNADCAPQRNENLDYQNAFLALSFEPVALEQSATTQVVTREGFAGLRLGGDIPSWPENDD